MTQDELQTAINDPTWPTCAKCGAVSTGYVTIDGQHYCHPDFPQRVRHGAPWSQPTVLCEV